MSTYNSPVNITPLTRARSANVNDVDDAVATAFALIPSETLLKQGKVTYAADTGVADAYLVALAVSPASYADGLAISIKPAVTNTGAATINVNSLGVKSIRNIDGTPLAAGALVAGSPVWLIYSTTTGFFHLQASALSQSATGSYATLNGVETLANKTLTAPTINSATLSGLIIGGILSPSSILTEEGTLTFATDWVGTNSKLVKTPEGIVHLRLFLTTTGSPAAAAATLPVGFRPPAGIAPNVPACFVDASAGSANLSVFANINATSGVITFVSGASAMVTPATGDQAILITSFNTV